MNPIVKQEASRWGLIMASVSVIFYLIAYLFSLKLFVSIGVPMIAVNIILLVLAIRSAREQMEGFIEFKDAFTTAFVANVIASLIGTAVVIVIFNVLDPSAADEIQKIVIEQRIYLAERLKVPEPQIEKMVEDLSSINDFTIANQVRGFFIGLLFSAAISAILAAFLKKNKPVIYE
ncbi:MAG: DUF4199 domain-containing protein [Flavobacteriales bacterium]|nr:MAG: DUF4199 domain-containing protein [Flavobacteriales bacterium]